MKSRIILFILDVFLQGLLSKHAIKAEAYYWNQWIIMLFITKGDCVAIKMTLQSTTSAM